MLILLHIFLSSGKTVTAIGKSDVNFYFENINENLFFLYLRVKHIFLFHSLSDIIYNYTKKKKIMLESPIFNINHTGLTFDFEEFIKNELGLKLDSQTKREGNYYIMRSISMTS
jgi:hypothetical protein